MLVVDYVENIERSLSMVVLTYMVTISTLAKVIMLERGEIITMVMIAKKIKALGNHVAYLLPMLNVSTPNVNSNLQVNRVSIRVANPTYVVMMREMVGNET